MQKTGTSRKQAVCSSHRQLFIWSTGHLEDRCWQVGGDHNHIIPDGGSQEARIHTRMASCCCCWQVVPAWWICQFAYTIACSGNSAMPWPCIQLCVLTDLKTPQDWHLEGADFLSIDLQKTLKYKILEHLPNNHYGCVYMLRIAVTM